MFTKKQLRMIDMLTEQALKSDMRSLHGAAIVKNGKVISHGYNSTRICVNGSFVTSTHAEISVLYKALADSKSAQCKQLQY